MQAIKQFIKIPKDHKIIINVPEHITTEQRAEVILIIRDKQNKNKKYSIKEAISDPQYISDLKKVSEDFESIDNKGWE